MKTVIYHSADYDGIFCREIAKHFLGDQDVKYIGWNFGDHPLPFPRKEDSYIVMDLPLTAPFGLCFEDGWLARDNPMMMKEHRQIQPLDRIDWSQWTWIDHHASSIESHPKDIIGYRIDGVAACRLAWQWFTMVDGNTPRSLRAGGSEPISPAGVLPMVQHFKNREVSEPLAVRLAGEYDVWDHRGDGDVEFQFGLDTIEGAYLNRLLMHDDPVFSILEHGKSAMRCQQKRDADIVRERSFVREWEGLKFLCLTLAKCNSLTFAAKDIPETGHDALLGFYFNGRVWVVSLYHAKHRTDLDLSAIATKYGGGGHRGACGFQCEKLPFLP